MHHLMEAISQHFSLVSGMQEISESIDNLLYLLFIILFSVHASISEEAKKEIGLRDIYDMKIPAACLKTLSFFTFNIVDRLYEVPSDWLKLMNPILAWLSMHKRDGIFGQVMRKEQSLREELGRIHHQVSFFCQD